ncbi:MAG: B12-binding domain-containing radical SAM protein [bacterium]
MKRRRVLLLNPPGFQIYIRDYYCSKVSKAKYIYHPVDLLMLSGIVAEHHDIYVLDGIIDGWTHYNAMRSIRSFRPDVIIFLTGVASFKEDMQFIGELKRLMPFVSVASGELFLEGPRERLSAMPLVDATVLDFTEMSILDLIDRVGEPGVLEEGPPIRNIVYRSRDKIIGENDLVRTGVDFEIPIPRHDLFPNDRYRYPFVRDFPFATVLTDFGCPFTCEFCAISRLGYKKRSIDNVLQELDFIKALGFRDIYFDDQTFGADRSRIEKLLNAMIERRYGFGFISFTRADIVDLDFLKLLKAAGCHSLVFGIEGSGDRNLESIQKGLTIDVVRQAISWCRKLGIRTIGTFIVGLPGMTVEEAANIGSFAADLNLDFASFNVPAPRPGTGLRKRALEEGWIQEDLMEMDQSGSYAVMGNEFMTAEQVEFYRQQASKTFYFRFSYLLRRFLNIRAWYEVKSHLTEGLDLLLPKTFVKKH